MVTFPLQIHERVTSDTLSEFYDLTATASTGGMYPVGANGLWHGGVHLSVGENMPIYAPVGGRIVAARLDPDEERATCAFGHTNFILTKHTWTPSDSEEDGTPFYMLFMHLEPRSLETVAQTAKEAPWLTGEPLLRVTASSGLTVRSSSDPEAAVRGGVPTDGLLKPLSEPTTPSDEKSSYRTSGDGTSGDTTRYRWQEVAVLGQDLEGYVALGELGDNGALDTQWTEEAPPPGGADMVGKLESGNVAKLDVPIDAGEMLWWTGQYGKEMEWADEFESFMDDAIANTRELMGEGFEHPSPIERAPTVHWEVFSGEKVLGAEQSGQKSSGQGAQQGGSESGDASNETESTSLELPSWTTKTTSSNKRTMAPSESDALSLIEQKRSEAPDFPDPPPYRSCELGEKQVIYALEAGKPLRRYAVKNVSEWGIQVNQKLKEAIKKSPSRQKSEKEDLKAMQWWKAANNAGVDLPDSPKVWHYHPVTALQALAAKHPWFYVKDADGQPAVETMDDVHQAGGQDVHVSEKSDTWLLGHEHEEQGIYNRAPSSANLYELLIDPADQEGVPSGELSDHERRVWASLSAIEGHLRAVNTWDSAYLSVGPLQKTAGAQYRGTTAKGELFGAIDFLLNLSSYEEGAFLSEQERKPFREAFQRHFGGRLSFAEGEIQFGVPKAHPEVNGTVWSSPAQKEQLRSELEWAYQFAKAYTDPNFREPMLRKGLGRLEKIMSQQLRFTVTVNGTEHTLQPELRDVFSRDLSQALLLDWHINYPASVWEPENNGWFALSDSDRDDRETYLIEKLEEWEITSAADLPLSRNRELRLVVLLLRARMDSDMTDPAGRAGKILRYASHDLIEEIVETMGFTRGENKSQMAFIQRGFEEELHDVDQQGNETSAWDGWYRGRRPEDPNQNAVLTDFDQQSNSE